MPEIGKKGLQTQRHADSYQKFIEKKNMTIQKAFGAARKRVRVGKVERTSQSPFDTIKATS